MHHYQIINAYSGAELGPYQAASEADALEALAIDAGYKSYADLCHTVGCDADELIISICQ